MSLPRRILIVEEESLIGWSMANALRRAGFDPEVVDCGEVAVERVRSGGIDLVISDSRLPGIDGLNLAAKVKAMARALPFIIIGSREEQGPAETDAGIDHFIEKPFNVREIVVLVGEILQPADSNLRNTPSPEN